MTIIYLYRVATTSLGGFGKLLITWRGSVYKLLYKEFLIFASLYFSLSFAYRFAMSDQQKLLFEKAAKYANGFTNLIPISFVLGFYVTIVVNRWWQQFLNVPWSDRTVFLMCTYLNGTDERAKMMRRAVVRYIIFGLIIILRAISLSVKKRFPTNDHIVKAGYITKEEAEMFDSVKCKYLPFWVPLMWANNVLMRARLEGYIATEFGLRLIVEALADFRDKCSLCFVYDWITVPLVYTQVVTIATYSFFVACLIGRQFLDPSKSYEGYEFDYFIPIFTFLQFVFYMGWLKVAEQMINPFGEDDDDYDINWLIDRHAGVAFALADQCAGRLPPLIRDPNWDQAIMPDIPYTEESMPSKRPDFLGSTSNMAPVAGEDARPDGLAFRRRSLAGSMLSLFFNKRHNAPTGSHETIMSSKENLSHFQVNRSQLMPNGRTGYHAVHGAEENILVGRPRSNTEMLDLPPFLPGQQRKYSLPLNLHLFSRKDRSRETPSPKSTRFIIEPVDELSGSIESFDSDTPQPPTSKTVQLLNSYQHKGGPLVSRPPHLSDIEEGSTVTSLRQLLSSPDTSRTEDSISKETDTLLLEDINEEHEHDDDPKTALVPKAPLIFIDEC